MFTILLVLFTMTMFLWLLSLLGASQNVALAVTASPWLAFFACLFLGLVVFLTGSGMVTVQSFR
jgi:succinate dehydrogenase hydrophobic anchor subunit